MHERLMLLASKRDRTTTESNLIRATKDKCQRQLQHWLEVTYMTERLHQALDYLTPAEFELVAGSQPCYPTLSPVYFLPEKPSHYKKDRYCATPVAESDLHFG
jgi:hypothetical protein